MKLIITLIGIAVALSSCSELNRLYKKVDERKINLQENDKKIEVSVKDFNIKAKKNKKYYWYDNNQVFNNMGSYEGILLHGDYVVRNEDGKLIEKSVYRKGLIKGREYQWNENGTYSKINRYSKGVLSGKFKVYDDYGNLIAKGVHRKGKVKRMKQLDLIIKEKEKKIKDKMEKKNVKDKKQ